MLSTRARKGRRQRTVQLRTTVLLLLLIVSKKEGWASIGKRREGSAEGEKRGRTEALAPHQARDASKLRAVSTHPPWAHTAATELQEGGGTAAPGYK